MKPFLCLGLFLLTTSAVATSTAPNWPLVRASERGVYYVKSVPRDVGGTKGRTEVFRVGARRDKRIAKYDWYGFSIEINESHSPTLLRFGPSTREDGDQTLAIGIYRSGKVVREYSVRDMQKLGSMAGSENYRYRRSWTHLGFTSTGSGLEVYRIRAPEGIVFMIDLESGTITEEGTEQSERGNPG